MLIRDVDSISGKVTKEASTASEKDIIMNYKLKQQKNLLKIWCRTLFTNELKCIFEISAEEYVKIGYQISKNF